MLVSGTKYEHRWAKIGDDKIGESNKFKLLGVATNNKLKLDSHIANICLKANQKLSPLSRLAGSLTFDRKWILFKPFCESQYKYCPLIWIFCSRTVNNRIDELYERALRLVHGDYETSFFDLLVIDGSFTVHHTNIQTLLLEMYKIKHNSSENCLKVQFRVVNGNCNLRFRSDFGVLGISTAFLRCQFD